MDHSLLKKHFEDAPRMEPQDAVKLAFQSAFGCGHLLPGQDRCVEMIRRECASTPVNEKTPLYTPIGNGLCRLNLAAPAVRMLDAEIIDAMMRLTSDFVLERPDNDQRFEDAAGAIAALAQQGKAPFSAGQFEAYFDHYTAEGRPVVSHTQTYRDAYAPAYRVVLTDLAVLVPVLVKKTSLVVIDGPCGSGKTTLARWLGKLCGVEPVPMDDFFLPFDMRTQERLAEPGGNLHRERFLEEVIGSLQKGGAVEWQRFDCQSDDILPRRREKADMVIVEGSYSHHPAFGEAWDGLGALRVFVSVGEEEQLSRIARRDPELLTAFQSRWIPLEKTYFEAYDIRGQADLVLESQPWME